MKDIQWDLSNLIVNLQSPQHDVLAGYRLMELLQRPLIVPNISSLVEVALHNELFR